MADDWDKPNIINNSKSARIEDFSQTLQYPPNEYVDQRLFGPLFSILYIWFDIKTKEGKKVSIPKICLDYDPKEHKIVREICPYRASGNGRMAQVFYSNSIIRDLQNAEPKKTPKPTRYERKKRPLVPGSDTLYYVKEAGSKSWTPVRLVKLTSTTMTKADKLKSKNIHKVKGEKTAYSIAHPKYGRDISISFDPNAAGAAMYDIQNGEPSPLTEKEQNYLMQPFFTKAVEPLDVKSAKKDMTQLLSVLVKKKGEDDDDDDDKKSKKSSKNKSRNRDRDSDRNKSNKNKKRRDNEKSTPKAKSKSKSKDKKKKSSWDDDEIPF